MSKKIAVLSLSGGMDSSTLLVWLMAQGYKVVCISFDYGQKHRIELAKADELVKYLMAATGKMIIHQVIRLDGLSGLLNSTLVEGGDDVPEGHYEDENMKETVVPNRNKIFSSIIQAVALSQQKEFPEADVVISMGIHAGDHAVYPDCRQQFRDADYTAFVEGNWDADRIKLETPFILVDKGEILERGWQACKELKISFNQVYKRTLTSYKPIEIDGKWYSDYKSASSVERVEAFIALGIPDPALYADEIGPCSWEKVVLEVTKVLEANNG